MRDLLTARSEKSRRARKEAFSSPFLTPFTEILVYRLRSGYPQGFDCRNPHKCQNPWRPKSLI